MTSPVTSQTFHQAPQHQIPVRLDNHIHKVDDDNASNVAQPQLTHDFFGCFQVVLGDGFFQGSPRTNVTPGIDVNNRHRFGPVNNQVTAAGQPHFTFETFRKLFIDAVGGKNVVLAFPMLQAVL